MGTFLVASFDRFDFETPIYNGTPDTNLDALIWSGSELIIPASVSWLTSYDPLSIFIKEKNDYLYCQEPYNICIYMGIM